MTDAVCRVCGADGMRPLYRAARDYITGDYFEVRFCATCSCGRTSVSAEDLSRYYPTQYRRYNRIISRILQVLYRRRVTRWARLFAVPGSVFEVGCGNGLMLAMLQDLGWRVVGSERTPAAARLPHEQYGYPVVVGGPDALDPAERFDLLLMIQVLEHLDDASATLRALAARLKLGGKLVIGVPNFTSWQSRFGGDTWFHLDVPRHLHHFSLQGLTALIGQNGLTVETVSYISPEHDPFGWIQSVLNRIDTRANRLTRLLMRMDRPDLANSLHLAAACILGLAAIPLSIVGWMTGQGALMEVTCGRCGHGPCGQSGPQLGKIDEN
jgi:SAM-dependent methyltransferase